MKRKLVSMILALAMVAALLAGCGGSSGGGGSAAAGSGGATPSDPNAIKIGVVWPGFIDSTGAKMKALMDQAAEVLGVELVYANGDFDGAAQTASIETLINSGAKGIIFGPWADSSWPKIAEVCESANVPFLSIHRDIADQEIKDLIFANPMFAGIVVENEYENAKKIAEYMVNEAGCKHFAVMTNPPGFTTDDLRNQGYHDALQPYVDSGQITIDVEYTFPTSDTTTAVSDAVDNFCLSYPDLDAILASGTGYGIGESISSSLAKNGKQGKIKIGGFDTYAAMDTDIASGDIAILSGGHVSTGMWGLIVLYNKIIGHPLSESGRTYYTNYIFLTDQEDVDFYNSFIINPDVEVWTDEEIAQMSCENNPDFNEAALEEIIANWTVEGIQERVNSR